MYLGRIAKAEATDGHARHGSSTEGDSRQSFVLSRGGADRTHSKRLVHVHIWVIESVIFHSILRLLPEFLGAGCNREARGVHFMENPILRCLDVCLVFGVRDDNVHSYRLRKRRDST